MEPTFFIDVLPPEHTEIIKTLAQHFDVSFPFMLQTLSGLNPRIEENKKINFENFCLLTGFIIAAISKGNRLTMHQQLQQRWLDVDTHYHNYLNTNL